MAKTTGLGQRFYLAQTGANGPAYDISGDVGSIDTCDQMLATIDVTGINKSAFERLPGLLDAKLAYTGFWNPAAGGGQNVTKGLKGLEALAIWAHSAAEGAAGFGIEGLVTGYAVNRAQNGALTIKPTIETDPGTAGTWGTIGANATDASGASHTVIDGGQQAPAVSITGITLASPGVVTAAAHGLTSGDTIFVSGTNSTPVLDGDRTVTVINANTFTVAVNTTGSGSAGSFYRTSTRFGGRLLALVLAIGSGNVQLKLQDSADNSTFNDLTGMSSGNLNATTSSLLLVAGATALWRRYLKIVSLGTFTNAQIVGLVHRATG